VCEDIDECATNTDLCDDAEGECSNFIEGYGCNCASGSFGDGFFCKGTDDCASDPCSNGASCENTPDGFACSCPSGFGGVDCSISCAAITFSDTALDTLVRDLIDKPSGAIVPSDLEAFTSLEIPADAGVSSLSGMQCWQSLQNLSLPNTGITDLSELEGLTRLIVLDATCPVWTDLSPVADLTQLEELNVGRPSTGCTSTQFSSLAQLSDLKKLVELNLSSHQLTSLAGVNELPRLQRLYVGGNQLTALSNLASAFALEELVVAENSLSSPPDLSSLKSLRRLFLSANSLDSLGDLNLLTWLDYIDLSSNSLNEIDGIGNLAEVGEVNLSFNDIEDIAPLASLDASVSLFVSGNKIDDLLPLTENADFGRSGELWLDQNPLSCSSQQELIDELSDRGLNIFGSCQED
jgi:hypothetical protein